MLYVHQQKRSIHYCHNKSINEVNEGKKTSNEYQQVDDEEVIEVYVGSKLFFWKVLAALLDEEVGSSVAAVGDLY